MATEAAAAKIDVPFILLSLLTSSPRCVVASHADDEWPWPMILFIDKHLLIFLSSPIDLSKLVCIMLENPSSKSQIPDNPTAASCRANEKLSSSPPWRSGGLLHWRANPNRMAGYCSVVLATPGICTRDTQFAALEIAKRLPQLARNPVPQSGSWVGEALVRGREAGAEHTDNRPRQKSRYPGFFEAEPTTGCL